MTNSIQICINSIYDTAFFDIRFFSSSYCKYARDEHIVNVKQACWSNVPYDVTKILSMSNEAIQNKTINVVRQRWKQCGHIYSYIFLGALLFTTIKYKHIIILRRWTDFFLEVINRDFLFCLHAILCEQIFSHFLYTWISERFCVFFFVCIII